MLCGAITVHAQDNIEHILEEIEQNNTTLAAARKTMEATKAGNHTGLTLDDPEVELAYLWGSPRQMGNRKNIDISQSFDMATLTGAKKRLARQQDALAAYQYKADRTDIMLEARLLCTDIIYYNASIKILNLRLADAETIAATIAKKLEKGDANIMEHNNASMSVSQIKIDIKSKEAERNAATASLQRLNGGKPTRLQATEYAPTAMPDDFNSWYMEAEKQSPVLAYARQAVEVARHQVKVVRAEGMPKLTAGFSGEYINDEKLNGITFGMSIPLWSNKNRVRQAKAEAEASEARQTDTKLQLYSNLRLLYQRQAAQHEMVKTYNEAVNAAKSNIRLQKKALEQGAVSVDEYIFATSTCYEMECKQLEAIRDWQKTLAEMKSFY